MTRNGEKIVSGQNLLKQFAKMDQKSVVIGRMLT